MTVAHLSRTLVVLALFACVSGQKQPAGQPACPNSVKPSPSLRPTGNTGLVFFTLTNLYGKNEPDIGSTVPQGGTSCASLTVIDLRDFLTSTGSTFCSQSSVNVVQTTTQNVIAGDPVFQAKGDCGPRTSFAGQVASTKPSTYYTNLSYSIAKTTNGQVLFGVFDSVKCTANYINMSKFLATPAQSPANLCSVLKLVPG